MEKADPIEILVPNWRELLRENLDSVRRHIEDAADEARRHPDDVRLVAVTKNAPAIVIDELLDLGIDAIGENRPEEIVRKQGLIERPVPWHMIGHFQRKKVARAVNLLAMVHSVHSIDLLGTLDTRVMQESGADRPLPVLLQVNISGEDSKQGFAPRDVADVLDLAEAMRGVTPIGLMTMAPYDTPRDEVHDIFGRLRDLAEGLGRERLPELSMGMSGDFYEAILEGATLVRIGSALFDGLVRDR